MKILMVICISVVVIATVVIYQFVQSEIRREQELEAARIAEEKYQEWLKYPYKNCDTTSTPGLAVCPP